MFCSLYRKEVEMQLQQQNRTTALYCRLSRDDDFQGDSASIQTQKAMLSQYAAQQGFYGTAYYVDDGYSGTTFERPDFQRLLSDIEDGKIGTVITKDLSRLGRDYLKTGFYVECFFPENSVRYIAVNDGVDTAKGDNEFAPFRNIMNEWYARDISKKIKLAYKTKALKGEFTASYAPYGYKKDPNDKHRLIVDEETAPIVKRIFELAAQGLTIYRICTILKADKIMKPWARQMATGKYVTELYTKYPYDWAGQTIVQMLRNQEYLGHMVANKHTTKSFKSKKLVALPPEEWVVVKNTHEPIIDEETFAIAQKVVPIRRRISKLGTPQIFVGLLRCPDCGKTFSYAQKISKGSYACSTYRRYGKEYCSMHYISYADLYSVVLEDIRKQAQTAKLEPGKLLEQLTRANELKNRQSVTQFQKEITKTERRIEELDGIIKRLYEDNLSGKLTDERFLILSKGYETEQRTLKADVERLKQELTAFADKKVNSERFAEIVKKYSDIKELNTAILNELIDKIVIHEARYPDDGKKYHGCRETRRHRTQQIDIYYNFVGTL